MSDKATLTSSIFNAIMTFSSGVLRSKKTVSRVSEKVPSHLLQRKMRRLPLVFGEAPMLLRYDLKKGSSKMRLMKTSLATLRLLWKRRIGR